MTTSLSAQLQSLETPETNLFDHGRGRPSILYSVSEARSHSRDDLYKIGNSGFLELVEVDNKFSKFHKTLFDEKSKDLQRSILLKGANESLDKNIEEFLLLLSPYLEKGAALKALEWLVFRYMINEKNTDSLMRCILPYYETNIFVRILQIIPIEKFKSPWTWLGKHQKKNLPVPKRTIFLQWSSNQWFRNFILKTLKKILDIGKETMKTPMMFIITTVVGGVHSLHEVKEEHVSSILMFFSSCMESKYEEHIAGMYVLLMQLAVKVKLSASFLDKVLHKICLNIPQNLVERFALCLLVLCSHQDINVFKVSVMSTLQSNEALLKCLSAIAREKCVSPFFTTYIRSLIANLFNENSLPDSKKIELFTSLTTLLIITPFSQKESAEIINCFCDEVLQYSGVILELKSDLDFDIILLEMEKSHPIGCDKAASKLSLVSSMFKTSNFSLKMKIKEIGKDDNPKKEKKKLKPINSLKKLLSSYAAFEKKSSNCVWLIDLEDDAEFAALLNDIFGVIFSSFNMTKDAHVKFLKMMGKVFENIPQNAKHKLYFLSLIWSWHPDFKCKGTFPVSLKIAALKLASAILRLQKKEDILYILGSSELFFPSLLVPLCQGVKELSSAVFEVIGALAHLKGSEENIAPHILLRKLLEFQDEICADVAYLPAAVSRITNKKNGKKVVLYLLNVITNGRYPLHIRASLLYLISYDGSEEVLKSLEPLAYSLLAQIECLNKDEKLSPIPSLCIYYILLKFSSASSSFLETDKVWVLFFKCIQITKPILQVTGQSFSPMELVVTTNLLEKISNADKMLDVLKALLTQAVQSDNTEEASKLRKLLKKISIKSSVVVHLIESLNLVSEVTSIKKARQDREKLEKRRLSGLEESTALGWKILGLTVELVGVMTNLKEPWLLLECLCRHLKQTLSLENSSTDLLQQQILSVILHLVEEAIKILDKDELIKSLHLDVVVLVQCIRLSINSDTHRRALLVLACVAEYFPEAVLHNILTIFTFMGSSLLRRDDSYSFQVIEQTVTSIVPTLIKKESSDPKTLLPTLAQVTQVFVDALPDLPEHRKLPLFLQLATTLGVSQYLWLVTTLIVDFLVVHKEEDPRRPASSNVQFLSLLYSHFSVLEQLKAIHEIILFISHLPDDKELFVKTKPEDRSHYTLIINMTNHNSKQLRHLKYASLSLLVHILSSETFVGQILEVTYQGEQSAELVKIYKSLLTNSLQYWEQTVKKEKAHTDAGLIKYYSSIQRKMLDVVNSVNSLLPPDILIEVVSRLLTYEIPSIRLRALEILTTKLQPSLHFFRDSDNFSFVSFLNPLIEMGVDSSNLEELRQHSFYVLQLLIPYLDQETQKQFLIPHLSTLTELLQNGQMSIKLQSSSILLVAEMIDALKVLSLPSLDAVIRLLVNNLESGVSEGIQTESFLNLSASIHALERITETMTTFLSKYLEKLLCIICKLLYVLEGSSQKEADLKNTLSKIQHCFINKLSTRVIIPAIEKTYRDLCEKHIQTIPILMKMIEAFVNTNPSDLVFCKKSFMSLFTSAFDLRNSMVCLSDIDRMESCTISAQCSFLFKLNEDDNIVIFNSLLSWAQNSINEHPTRMITFFRFSDHMVSTFRALFIKAKLAEKVFGVAADILNRNNSLHNETSIFSGDEEKTCLLLNYVLDTLKKIFLYDSVHFTNEEKFTTILKPLTDQLENMIGGEKCYFDRIRDHLKPCIVQFTTAVDDVTLWKELNRLILVRVRNDETPKIILAALEIFEGLMESLGENYLQPLLGDIMTYITEVLESVDSEVEDKARYVFKRLESILGETLEMYLDN